MPAVSSTLSPARSAIRSPSPVSDRRCARLSSASSSAQSIRSVSDWAAGIRSGSSADEGPARGAPPPRFEAVRARAASTRIRRMICADSAKKCARSLQFTSRAFVSRIHLVHQRCALQRGASALAPHMAPGLRMQLGVDQRHELLERFLVSPAPCLQKAGDVGRFGHAPIVVLHPSPVAVRKVAHHAERMRPELPSQRTGPSLRLTARRISDALPHRRGRPARVPGARPTARLCPRHEGLRPIRPRGPHMRGPRSHLRRPASGHGGGQAHRAGRAEADRPGEPQRRRLRLRRGPAGLRDQRVQGGRARIGRRQRDLAGAGARQPERRHADGDGPRVGWLGRLLHHQRANAGRPRPERQQRTDTRREGRREPRPRAPRTARSSWST